MSVLKLAAGFAGLLLIAAAPAAVVKNPHVEVELASQTTAVAPGSTAYLAVRETIIPKWHTYWRNAGDSGEPTSVTWTLPKGWKAGEIVWPAPQHRLKTGPLVNYVFSDTVYLPTPIEAPADAKPGVYPVKAKVDYLVCADICVPESAELALNVTVAEGSAVLDPKHGDPITKTLADAPKSAGLKAAFAREGDTLKLAVTGAALKGKDARSAWFYPYDGTAIDHAKPQLVQRGPEGVTLTLPAGYAFQRGTPLSELKGVIAYGPGEAWEVAATTGPAPAGAAGSGAAVPSAPEGSAGQGGGEARGGGGGFSLAALAGYVGAAFLGGLILNLMPCVFPVLSIKAAQLVRHGGSPGEARAEGLAFLAGVVATFLALAAALLIAKAGGEAVGWGFQLQNPLVTALLALLLLAAALNLSGVFEVGTSVQGAGGGLAGKGGLVGAFFTGALAVVVAAPCTAPFMAGAIGWAVTAPTAAALLVFAALGVGLAAPFVLIAFSPALLSRLPKPGPWMGVVKAVLAFPMYGAAAWLAWVFAQQAGFLGLPLLFAAAVVLAFGLWLWGWSQRREAEGARALPLQIGAGLAAAVALAAVVVGGKEGPATAQASTLASVPGAGLTPEPWSPERVSALRAEGRPVFVDFTAAWCVTCQVNERTALAGRGVADAFAKHKAVYLKADWTKRDAAIAQELSSHGRSGVPLYLVYSATGEPAILPQLLTEGMVVQALETAAKPG